MQAKKHDPDIPEVIMNRRQQDALAKAAKHCSTEVAVVQVQKDIPVGLLIRTDTLPQLGFALVETDTCGMGIDLYRNRLGRSSQVEDATQCANMTNLLLTSWL